MRSLAVVALLVACGPTARPPAAPPTPAEQPEPQAEPPAPTITVAPAPDKATLRVLPRLAAGQYRIHLIDVGTGLAILVEGADFRLLYDAGSGDDYRGGHNSRVVAYLAAALGPSGGAACKPNGDDWSDWDASASVKLDHVVQSHPHLDHGSMLDDVFACFEVSTFWDSGVINQAAFIEDLWEAVAAEPDVAIRTAAPAPADRVVKVRDSSIQIPASSSWSTFAEGDRVELGQGASFKVLHANPTEGNDYNENSIVLRVELGGVVLLLTGDAESGPRADPSAEVGDVEAHLLEHYATDIDADILQVGHHGSKTSSRSTFLAAVTPRYALVSAGPKKYGSVVLPDAEVIEALEAVGAKVLRTDARDGSCPVADRIGDDDQKRPGGGDSEVILIVR